MSDEPHGRQQSRDGHSDAMRRGVADIRATGAAWVTEMELAWLCDRLAELEEMAQRLLASPPCSDYAPHRHHRIVVAVGSADATVSDPLGDAITVLENMRVTTEPMAAHEMNDIEQRRVTALGYLRMIGPYRVVIGMTDPPLSYIDPSGGLSRGE